MSSSSHISTWSKLTLFHKLLLTSERSDRSAFSEQNLNIKHTLYLSTNLIPAYILIKYAGGCTAQKLAYDDAEEQLR